MNTMNYSKVFGSQIFDTDVKFLKCIEFHSDGVTELPSDLKVEKLIINSCSANVHIPILNHLIELTIRTEKNSICTFAGGSKLKVIRYYNNMFSEKINITIPIVLPSLESLYINNCIVKTIEMYNNLFEIIVSKCVIDLIKFNDIEVLDIKESDIKQIEEAKLIFNLRMQDCVKTPSISLLRVSHLELIRCFHHSHLSIKQDLQTLFIDKCGITNISDIPYLDHLHFSGSNLEKIYNLPKMKVCIIENDNGTKLKIINGFPSLQHLSLSDFPNIDVQYLPRLMEIYLYFCNITNVENLSRQSSLENWSKDKAPNGLRFLLYACKEENEVSFPNEY